MGNAFLLAGHERFSRLHGDLASDCGFVCDVDENGETIIRHGRWRKDGSLTGEVGGCDRTDREWLNSLSTRNFSLLAEDGEV